MTNYSTDRRKFLKQFGMGSVLLGSGLAIPEIIGKTSAGPLVRSEEEYGKFPVIKMANGKLPYEIDPKVFKRMNERFTVFSRNGWDQVRKERPGAKENITNRNLVEGKGVVPNQSRLDYALMSASWSMARLSNSPCYKWETSSYGTRRMGADRLGKWDPATLDMGPEETSLAVKHASLFYGASLAGIAELNPAWLYSHIHSPTREDRLREIPFHYGGDRYEKTKDAWYVPSSMNKVIALAFEEDYEAIANSPGRLASAATGDGYSRMAQTAYKVAEFIRCLGYNALPAGNGTALSIPIAIDAGLGELGRNGLLITPKFGPRVRLAKVITDMPLVADHPIKFGVTEFCETCMLCAEDCPSESISKGSQTWKGLTASNNPGIHKWYIHPETCFDYNGFSCSNCKLNCPFNKPNNEWTHKLIRGAIKLKVNPLNSIMTEFDQASGYGKQVDSREFWKRDGSKKITSREKM